MIILGIDPGTARLGYGLLKKDGPRISHVAHGVIETPVGMAQPDRLGILHQRLIEVIAEYRPTLVGVEKLFFQKNVKTAMTVSEARGVILLSLQSQGLAIAEYTPMQIKQALTGYGGADKRQVQEMIKKILKLAEIPKPDDAADALAIAYCAAVSAPAPTKKAS